MTCLLHEHIVCVQGHRLCRLYAARRLRVKQNVYLLSKKRLVPLGIGLKPRDKAWVRCKLRIQKSLLLVLISLRIAQTRSQSWPFPGCRISTCKQAGSRVPYSLHIIQINLQDSASPICNILLQQAVRIGTGKRLYTVSLAGREPTNMFLYLYFSPSSSTKLSKNS